MSDSHFFHEASASVRFWITVDGKPFGASVGREALRHRYGAGDDPVETYVANAGDIQAAVRRRVGEGAREPVLLREYDLRVLGTEDRA